MFYNFGAWSTLFAKSVIFAHGAQCQLSINVTYLLEKLSVAVIHAQDQDLMR